VGKRLGVLVQSPGFPRAVTWFSKDWGKKIVEKYRARMVEYNNKGCGRQFLTLMGYESMAIWDPMSLRELEALLKDHEELCRKAGQKPAQANGVRPESAAAPPVTVPETSGRTDPQSSKGK
jgi:hypothetical protein